MLTLQHVKDNPYIKEFLEYTKYTLVVQGYTEHGLRHANIVSDRARMTARKIGLSEREQELSAIVGYCHDMGNFIGRTQHHYWGSMLFSQIFRAESDPKEFVILTQAIANHDKEEMKLVHPVAAVTVIADKSDVHRSRVLDTNKINLAKDIHDRVNHATTDSNLIINPKNKTISLKLKIDTNFVPLMEYFEIFTERMVYCRKAAVYLGYKFQLYINTVKLL